MKRIYHIAFMAAILIGSSLATHAQVSFTWAEFFKQKKTQQKYTMTQIAELQLYISALKQGYKLVESGLNTVKQIKDGEYNLHDIFYLSLKNVNPALLKYPASIQVVGRSLYVKNSVSKFLRQMAANPFLPDEQKAYIKRTCQALLADVDVNTDMLSMALTNGDLQLTDDERISQIQAAAARAESQYLFAQQFCDGARMITTGMKGERASQASVSALYDLK